MKNGVPVNLLSEVTILIVTSADSPTCRYKESGSKIKRIESLSTFSCIPKIKIGINMKIFFNMSSPTLVLIVYRTYI